MPASNVVNPIVELGEASLERTHHRICGTGEAPLKDAHCKVGGGSVQDASAVVIITDVVCRAVVKSLLTELAFGEVVAQRVRHAIRINPRAIEFYHLLLGAADEMATPRIGRISVESLLGGEDLGLQKPPEAIIWIVLTHVRRGGQQEQVAAIPAKTVVRVAIANPGKRLGSPVAISAPEREVGIQTGGQLVRLIEDRKVVGSHTEFAEPGKHPVASKSIDAYDDQVALGTNERI